MSAGGIRHPEHSQRRLCRALGLALATLLLASCGGGDGGDDGAAAGKDATARALGFQPGGVVPADAATRGMWSPVYDWPLIAVHAVLMPDGQVMSYGTDGAGKQTGKFIYDLWTSGGAPDAGHLTLPNGTPTDLFCSSQLVLPQGDPNVFIAGGDNWTGTATTNTGNKNSNLFKPASNTLVPGPNMNRARWYSTSTTLLNGEIYIQGGSGGTDRPEVRELAGNFRLLSTANTSTLGYSYPRNFVAPDGRLFGFDSNGRMYWVDASGTGAITLLGQLPIANRGVDSSAAMFRPGRILQFGGASNGAVVIDVSAGATPVVSPTQSMATQRRLATATLLADGKVLATGGSQVYNTLTGVNKTAEIWDPQTGQWSVGAAGARARLYHSSALLLPDASVLVTGGGAPGPENNRNGEIYYPPYLFAGGQWAARPGITAAPGAVEIGKTFAIDASGASAVARVVLVKTGSTTHGFNMDQRFLELGFVAAGAQLSVQAPTRAALAPPGYYMLFVIDAAGVPSEAKIVRIGVAAEPNPQIVPVLVNPGPQDAITATPATLSLNASDPNGDTLSFSATGLPPGMSLDAATGTIDGTPSLAGSYNVEVTASDRINATSTAFVWTVADPGALTLAPLPSPPPAQANASASFTASASGLNPLYRWNFGDGSFPTEWSASPEATHAYTRAGSFSVTLSVTDDRGLVQSRSFLQTVYLPATATPPQASSNLLIEQPAGGNARLWVVNQDNDSLTAFDAVNRAKLGEVAVGAAPRALALAGDGRLWVTNKTGASISVVDPASRSVVHTIALPRAAQPFGIAMSPSSPHAYVVLEATGQLLKIDTGSRAQVASLDVGANARHVSVSGDGTSLLVSRFLTPPLPGEATGTVATPDSAGGEVLIVDVATMTVASTAVLRHGTKADFENQGRGLPNYLGAAAISPDGTQAWVPSKQDNILRGGLRDGLGLNFQNTVRAASSRIVMATGQEDLAARIDHDNASVASAAVFDPLGVYLFVALETSREVAVIDAHAGFELMRIDTGRAPQGLAIDAEGKRLYVNNFMDRSVGVFDLEPLLARGAASVPLLATLQAVGTDKLTAKVLQGKRLFYDARDPRLARDRYMSCASCHNDGGQDGRVWDLTSLGEGLRNTVGLRGRAGAQGRLHWSANFDEVQDFEAQIRQLAGGSGLMSDAAFGTGTRSQPLGDRKTGASADLDALAAYVASLSTFDSTPHRAPGGALSTDGLAGRAVFDAKNCASCHGGTAFTGSGTVAAANIGTLKPSSGKRLGGALSGIDIPTLRDVWASAPYLHDGSAAGLGNAVLAHNNVSVTEPELASLVAFLREVGAEEPSAVIGGGLLGNYFNNKTLAGSPVLTRTEAVNFGWGTASPGPGVTADGFSVRWTGTLRPSSTGDYTFRTTSDDGVRVWIDDVLVIENWTVHGATNNDSAPIAMNAGQAYAIKVEYFEQISGATIRLNWRAPGTSTFVAVPKALLSPYSP